MIRTDRLCVQYDSFTALRDVSLAIPAGEITAIVGPSGCGKSSYLLALNRLTDLIPGARITGNIFVDGCNIHDQTCSPVALRRSVGMIFQKPNPFPLSIRRNIQLALREHVVRDRKRQEQLTVQALQDVGLWEEVRDRLDAPATGLSGGQQQRLCIARALALRPRALLMDEPCSSLDPIASQKVESLIRELSGQYTILIVTHNLAQARRIADHVAVFWLKDGAGQIIEQGPVEKVFAGPASPIAAAYLSGEQG